MITTDDIADILLTKLNAYAVSNNYEKTLSLHKDFATVRNDYKDKDTGETVYAKQYGIVRNQTSQLSKIAGALNMVTGNLTVDILCDITTEGEDGELPEVQALCNLINGFANSINGTYINTVVDMSNYAVLPVMSSATVGYYQEESSNWGAYVPVSFTFAYTALQNGAAPSMYKIMIDCQPLYCDSLVFSRIKTASADVKAAETNGITRTADDSTTFEIQLTAPFQRKSSESAVCDNILAEMLDGRSNAPHLVEVIQEQSSGTDKYISCYMMSIAKSQMTVASGSLVGLNLNLLEIDGDTAEYDQNSPAHDPKWGLQYCTTSNKSGTIWLSAGNYAVFWGDGTSEYRTTTSSTEVSHTYKQDSKYTVRYYKRR